MTKTIKDKVTKKSITRLQEEVDILKNRFFTIKVTKFFKFWQTYCKFRDKLLGKVPEDIEFSFIKGRDLYTKLYNLEVEKRYYQKQLNKISSAKAFKIWQLIIRIQTFIVSIIRIIIPEAIRKKFKYFLIYFISTKTTSFKIKNEWEKWSKIRSKNSIDIINFGITTFNYRFQRSQHLATELAKKGHRIFYIETEFLPALSLKLSQSKFNVEKQNNNTYIITITSVRNLFIYRDKPTEDDLNEMMTSIKKLIEEANIINPIAKIDHPFWASLFDKLAMPIIYDCMDEHKGFKENSSKTEELEETLIRNSDLVLVSSNFLHNKIRKIRPEKIVLLQNACDFFHFNKLLSEDIDEPFDLKNIPQPIIGYYGTIADWFDADLLEKIAKEQRDTSIVLLGRIQNKRVRQLSKKYKNIHLLGEKPYIELPNYLKYFRVCLIPFIINDLIKATDPVKIYEYFAAGKPVITTKIPELEKFKNELYIANNSTEFSKYIKLALRENDQKVVNRRLNIARENTWQKRGNLLNQILESSFFPKVSIIIVSFEKYNYTKNCIESIQKKSFYPNYEIIVVDNGSAYECIKCLKKINNKVGVRVIFNNKNLGFAAGNNIGMKKATGEYLILLNNDTIVTPGWISRLIYHVNKKDIGIVGPVTNNIGNEAKIDIVYDPNNLKDMEKTVRSYTSKHWGEVMNLPRIAAFCWMGKKITFKKIGELDERFYPGLFEDDDYCLRLKNRGYKILCADDVFVHHYLSVSTDSEPGFYKKYFEINKKKFEEKWKTKWIPHHYRSE